jgi:hypothetical protein
MGRPESATKKKEKAKAPISAGWIGTVHIFFDQEHVGEVLQLMSISWNSAAGVCGWWESDL